MVNFYNPDPEAVGAEEREANRAIRAQEDAAMRSMTNTRGEDSLSVRDREEAGVSPKVPNSQQMTEAQRGTNKKFNQGFLKTVFTSKNLRKRSSLIALLLGLFGGGSFLTVFLSPSLAIVHMKEVLTSELNSQVRDMDERSAVLLRSKLKDLTSGSCGAIKIRCDFTTITEKQAEKFKAAGIEVKMSDERAFYNNKRGKIESITFTDPDDNTRSLAITKASELQKALMNAENSSFRAAMLKGHNPLFAGLTDKVSLSVLRAYGATKGVVTKGDTDEERRKSVNNLVAGVEEGTSKSIRVETDDDGNKRYYDSSGNEMTQEQVDGAERSAGRIATKMQDGGFKNYLTTAAQGANAIAYVDTACTVFNSIRTMYGLAKTVREAQAVRYAMAMVLTPADSIKAGDAQEGDINFVGNTLMQPAPATQTVDASKIMLVSDSEPLPTTENPEAGATALDSPYYKMAAYQEVPEVSLRASQYMLAGSSNVLNDAIKYITSAITSSADPQKVSEMCGYVQNPVVRITGLAIGVAAGIGTFGVTTALSMGGALGIAMLLPYAEAQIADMVAGNVFKDISGVDSGDAAVVGSLALFGGIAKKRGSKPLSSQEALQYAAADKSSYAQYVASQQQLAKDTPFDVNNPYSFVGSISSKITPTLQRSKTNASVAMINIASLIPASFASLIPGAGAASSKPANYFEQCNDIGYQRLNIGGDAACGVRYGLMSKLDPVENLDWMLANKEINENGEAIAQGGVAGAVQGGAIGASVWNYEKFLRECSNRTMGWGENQDENQGDGSNCVSDENEAKNVHYRTFTFDKSVNETLDGEPVAMAGGSGTGIEQTGDDVIVSTDGWKYPVSLDFNIISDFQTPERPTHQGVDLVSGNNRPTLGSTIYAAYDGTVKEAGPISGHGHWIIIEHMIDGKKISTVYSHMYADGLKVKKGDVVKAGDSIGVIGSDGDSTGPHLHFEVWNGSPLENGKPRDPKEFLDAARKSQEAINV